MYTQYRSSSSVLKVNGNPILVADHQIADVGSATSDSQVLKVELDAADDPYQELLLIHTGTAGCDYRIL